MKRRDFIKSVVGAAAFVPRAARAENRMPRVAVLTGNVATDPDARSRVEAFRQGLAGLGWPEGRNVQIEVAWPGPEIESQRGHARQLVALKPDVILATSTRTTMALRDLTRTIPIVFVGLSDPVATGVVSNLGRPEGNVTGFMLYEHSLAGKWLELLKDVAPPIAQVSVLFNPDTSPYAPFYVRAAQEVGTHFGIEVTAAGIRQTAELEPAIAAIAGAGDGGLLVLPDGGFTATNGATTIALAAQYRVPAIYAVRFYAANGGLMSYGADLTDQFRDGATYVDRILRGARPADLPVQFASKFDLAINRKAAHALGLTIPRQLMVEAELID